MLQTPRQESTRQAWPCAAGDVGAAQPGISVRLLLSRGYKWNQDRRSLPGSGLECLLVGVERGGAWGPLGSQFLECDAVPSSAKPGSEVGIGRSVELWDPVQGGAGPPPALPPDPALLPGGVGTRAWLGLQISPRVPNLLPASCCRHP